MAGKIKAQFFISMSQQQELKNGSLLWRPKEKNWDRCWYFDLVLTTSEYHPFPVSVIFSSVLIGLNPTSTPKYMSHLLPLSYSMLHGCLFQILHQLDLPFIEHLCTCIYFLFLDLFPESCPLPLFQNSPTCVGNKSLFGHTKALLSWILTCEPNLGREYPSS